jgi:hypothetical protein
MFTDGGLGVALLAPFDNRRFFFPFQPIEVASFGVGWLFTRRGAVVLASGKNGRKASPSRSHSARISGPRTESRGREGEPRIPTPREDKPRVR